MTSPADPWARCDRATFARMWRCHRITTQEIADFLGVSRQAVTDRARRMGLPLRTKVRRKLRRDDELRSMWLAGVNCSDMARHFGFAHRSCVTKAAADLGLPRRKRGGGGPGGWTGTISIAAYFEERLGLRMKEELRRAA
jgi:hypothetical protein